MTFLRQVSNSIETNEPPSLIYHLVVVIQLWHRRLGEISFDYLWISMTKLLSTVSNCPVGSPCDDVKPQRRRPRGTGKASVRVYGGGGGGRLTRHDVLCRLCMKVARGVRPDTVVCCWWVCFGLSNRTPMKWISRNKWFLHVVSQIALVAPNSNCRSRFCFFVFWPNCDISLT